MQTRFNDDFNSFYKQFGLFYSFRRPTTVDWMKRAFISNWNFVAILIGLIRYLAVKNIDLINSTRWTMI